MGPGRAHQFDVEYPCLLLSPDLHLLTTGIANFRFRLFKNKSIPTEFNIFLHFFVQDT